MHTSYEAPSADLGTVVIRIEGELDAFAAPDLKQQLFACLDSDFHNGREYERFAGRAITVPSVLADQPGPELLEWHAAEVFRG